MGEGIGNLSHRDRGQYVKAKRMCGERETK